MKLNYICFNNSMFKVNENIKITVRYDKIKEIKKYIQTNKYKQNILYLDLYLKSIDINNYNDNNYIILYFNNYGMIKNKKSYKFNDFLIIDLFNLNCIQYDNLKQDFLYLISKIFYHNLENHIIETNF